MIKTVLYILAVARATRLLLQDEITRPLREKVWAKFPPSSMLGYLFTCPWCISIYVAAVLAPALRADNSTKLLAALTASALTPAILSQLERLSQ